MPINSPTKTTRDGRVIPVQMWTQVKEIQDRGGKVFWAFPEFFDGCPNCNGTGQVTIQVVKGGPYDEPHSAAIKDHDGKVKYIDTAINEGGKWFKVRLQAFECPICHGAGAPPAGAVPQRRPTQQPVKDLAEQWQDTAYGD